MKVYIFEIHFEAYGQRRTELFKEYSMELISMYLAQQIARRHIWHITPTGHLHQLIVHMVSDSFNIKLD